MMPRSSRGGDVPFDEREERGIRIRRAGVGEQAVGSRVGDDAARPHEHSRSQRSASSMTWLLTMIVAPRVGEARNSAQSSARSTRVEPDRRLVEDEQLGRAEHRDRERDAALLPAAERVDGLVARCSVSPTSVDDAVDVAARRADEPREVAQVLLGS